VVTASGAKVCSSNAAPVAAVPQLEINSSQTMYHVLRSDHSYNLTELGQYWADLQQHKGSVG